MIKKIIWFLLINALAVFLVSHLLGEENFLVSYANAEAGDLTNFIAFTGVGFVLAIMNMIVRPILALLSLPLVIISFGLFLTLINIFLLWITEILFTEIFTSFEIVFVVGGEAGNSLSYLLSALCFSVINSILHFFGK